MRCKYCGYENAIQKQVCENCGNFIGAIEDNKYSAIGQYVEIPEGFLYDQDSGWYYHTEIVQRENGIQEQLVTYYDVLTQSYTQASYPMEDETEETISAAFHEPVQVADTDTEIVTPIYTDTETVMPDYSGAESEKPDFVERDTVPNAYADAEELSVNCTESGEKLSYTNGETEFEYEQEMIQDISIPNGFLYDQDSGWYYHTEIVQRENGIQEQLVTYYDALTQNYTQVSYPMEEEIEEAAPTASLGATYNDCTDSEAIRTDYTQTIKQKPDYTESKTQKPEYIENENVSANSKHTENIPVACGAINEEYPKNSEILKQEKNLEQNIINDAKEQVDRSDSHKKLNKKTLIKVVAALLVIGVISGVAYILVRQGKLPFLNKAGITEANSSEITQVLAEQSQANRNDALVQADIDAQWANNPNCSFLYNCASEDDKFVYFLPDSGHNTSPSRLCRMNKDGGQIEEIISVAAMQKPIQSFALLGDYIYFNVEMEDSYSTYFRIPKQGGDAEFLFIDEYSKITAHDGMLYFLFSKQIALGIYNPNKDSRPKLYTLNNGYSNFYFLQAFSINDGYLYYGIHYDDSDNNKQGEAYYRYSLEKTDIELLLSSEKLGEENVMNPFFVDGDVYYTEIDNSTGSAHWRVLKNGSPRSRILSSVTFVSQDGDPITAARMGESVLFQMENKFCMAPLKDLQEYSVIYENMNGPFGISQHWLLLPDCAMSTDGSKRFNYDNIVSVPLGNTDKAYAQAEETLKYTLSDLGKGYNSDSDKANTQMNTGKQDVNNSALEKAAEEKRNVSASKAGQKNNQSWVDKTGYKPKYFTWSKSEYSAQNIDNPEIPSGKWVNESGTTVAYLFYDSSPDVLDFEIFYNGKELNGFANVVQDGNSQMALCEEMKIFFHLDTLTGEVLLYNGNNMTLLKLVKAKF